MGNKRYIIWSEHVKESYYPTHFHRNNDVLQEQKQLEIQTTIQKIKNHPEDIKTKAGSAERNI